MLLGTAGFGLMLRAMTNLETKRLLGIDGRRAHPESGEMPREAAARQTQAV